MKNRTIWIFALIVVLFATLSAAGAPALKSSAATAAPTMAATGAAPVKEAKVALILIGPKNDGSWAEAAVNALTKLKDAGVETTFKESVADADAERQHSQAEQKAHAEDRRQREQHDGHAHPAPEQIDREERPAAAQRDSADDVAETVHPGA